ncbi:hypothetical protein EK21DRAFT_53876 [Setomelanomma holmii]|uniref:Uncharacterized protein n=1 Tax=Setomelanomma holmii TaxID=210430 RepID=A0A9P4HJ76_9PLEO|nr:hypothetical protein EK21DRAFT_53876 [Setomelanomma holmii]
MPSHHISSITIDTFNDVLDRYPPAAPEKLRDLDAQRYDTIPTTFAQRVASIEEAHLSKDEVEKLVEWKLKHGTFRPKLLGLVQSNSSSAIDSTTRAAFDLLPGGKPNTKDILAALKKLAELKGIGPATASLLLSVAAPDSVPFFSDELFRWCMWDEQGSPGGWQRKIKYNNKEYEELVPKVQALRKRLGEKVRALDIERVAWVLGNEAIDVGDDQVKDDAQEEEKTETTKEEEEVADTKDAEAKPKKGTKRKAAETKVPAEGTRKSSRTKR